MNVRATMSTMAGRISFSMALSSGEVQGRNDEVNGLDADEWNNDAPDAVDKKIAPQQRGGPNRTIAHAFQSERNEGDDDERVEDDSGEDCTLWCCQVHDVERLQLRIESEKHRGDDRKVLCHVVGDREGGQRTAGHQQLLGDFDHL